jgi:sugar (pentulose or hexulose) kinase
MARYIIAHDVGTSGNKAVLVDTEGHVTCLAYAADDGPAIRSRVYTKDKGR